MLSDPNDGQSCSIQGHTLSGDVRGEVGVDFRTADATLEIGCRQVVQGGPDLLGGVRKCRTSLAERSRGRRVVTLPWRRTPGLDLRNWWSIAIVRRPRRGVRVACRRIVCVDSFFRVSR